MKMSRSGSLAGVVVLAGALRVAAGPVDVSAYKEPIRVACVGDSITAGFGMIKGNSYPDQLGRMLGEKWTVKNFGVSSLTLMNQGDRPYQRHGVFSNALAFAPHVVVIKLGTNDTKSKNWQFKDGFVAEYKHLIAQFASLPTKPRIFLCRPAPVIGKGAFGIHAEILAEELPLVDKVAAEEKLDVIDVHGALAPHPEMIPDRVHPNTAGGTVIAGTVYRALTGKEYSGPAVAPQPPAPAPN